MVKGCSRIYKIGSTAQGMPLEVECFFSPTGLRWGDPLPEKFSAESLKIHGPWFLLLAAVHGDEVEGWDLVERFREELRQEMVFSELSVAIFSPVNPEGLQAVSRQNSNGVDLNRNLPTLDWTSEVQNPRYYPGVQAASESENQALLKVIEVLNPLAILSVHSYSQPMVNSNGPSRPWAEALSEVCRLPVTEDMGYPTPGSLGTYAGWERKIPTITLEILRGQKPEIYLPLHMMTLGAAIAYWEERLSQPPSIASDSAEGTSS